ncbi:MAG: SUMF1/EgtB/PvdO family nonheme iron enzyme [Opitutales bacterium]|jgi:formylglycine-generating enzyme|nr:SUMF1/EgtB/PvdO family nonheme iron enzyme [Opitutales bacterium]
MTTIEAMDLDLPENMSSPKKLDTNERVKDDLTIAKKIKDLPAFNVTWFASRACARWKGKRLPTVSEWELVGLASETNADDREEEGYYARIFEWYERPNRPIELWAPETFRNIYGVYGMHGLI